MDYGIPALSKPTPTVEGTTLITEPDATNGSDGPKSPGSQ